MKSGAVRNDITGESKSGIRHDWEISRSVIVFENRGMPVTAVKMNVDTIIKILSYSL